MGGRKTKGFFYRIGEAVLNPRVPKPRLRTPKEKKREIPKLLRGYFERRQLEWPEYVMFKVQVAILLLFAMAPIHLVFLRQYETHSLAAMIALSAYLVYLAATQVKQAFFADRGAYWTFIGMCLALVWGFLGVLKRLAPVLNAGSMFEIIFLVIAMIFAVVLAFAGFRIKYGRNYTFGTIRSVRGNKALVRIGYDICSNVKAGEYLVDSLVRVRPGDRVKVGVDRPLLGLRGSSVRAVLGKVGKSRASQRRRI